MRWPFGPPHLTLKPSKKKPKKTKKQTKKTKNERKSKKRKNTKKRAFQLSVNFFGGGGVQKLPFLTTWPRKRAPPKHYKNRGFSLFFFEKSYASRNGHFWTKKPKSRNSSYNFFLPFFLFQQQKTPKLAETHIFVVF